MSEKLDDLVVTIDADVSNLRRELEGAAKMGRSFGSSITRAFESAAIRGRKLGDVLRSLASSLAASALRAGMKPLQNMMGSAFGSLFAGAGAGGIGGKITPFADGGVVNSPVLFPMGKGAHGLMGEAGAEAIIPLARGPDGKLGVRSNGGAAGITINFNVQANDAESFLRSESQISAMLARATRRGSRNL